MKTNANSQTIVIGAGVAGLACAIRLTEAGRQVSIVEATDRVGGRVATDHVDGFTLDVGFQVLLTAYPACRALLDYDALRLRAFEPGAKVRHRGRLCTLGDPWRRPMQAISTALSPVASLGDKLRIAKLRAQSRQGSLQQLYELPDCSTESYLRELGFSESFIDEFFRPFLGGVYLDESLQVSRRMLDFVFRMFASGDIAVPADGMSAIPQQLVQRLPQGTVKFQQAVTSITDGTVHFSDGTEQKADQIVVATESDAAARLLQLPEIKTRWGQSTTIYYTGPAPKNAGKFLVLRGDEEGPIQTAVILSNVAREYAPGDAGLMSICLSENFSVPDPTDLDWVDRQVKKQARTWFGSCTDSWKFIRSYQLPFGLPQRSLDPVVRSVDASDHGGPKNVLLCGDYLETPSINGAMQAGLQAAEAILAK